jgi:hypothetical protein
MLRCDPHDSIGSQEPVTTFDRTKLPSNTPIEWVDAVNKGIDRLRARKFDEVDTEERTHFEFVARWIDIYLQSHIRRALSLIDGGLAELKAGRTIVTAFCARALLEDAAAVWSFIKRLNGLLDEGDNLKTDDFVFSKTLASRLPRYIEQWGQEYRATNVLSIIDQMAKEHPNVRPMYDELCDVCHPNLHGVLWHFAALSEEGVMTFDDGAKMADSALGSLIFAAIVFVGEEPAIARLEMKLDVLCGYHAD